MTPLTHAQSCELTQWREKRRRGGIYYARHETVSPAAEGSFSRQTGFVVSD